MKTSTIKALGILPALSCAIAWLGLLALGVTPSSAAPFTWDGTANTWPSVHWYSNEVLVAGGTVATDSYTITNGTVTFAANDTFGNANITASPAITVGGSGTLASGGFFNTVWNLTLQGGMLLPNGGVNLSFPAFQLDGTLTVSGTSPSLISAGSGNYPLLNIGGTSTSGNTLTINVADVTGNPNPDLTIAAALKNGRNPNVAGAILKTGAGTLVLSNPTNQYTGATTVSSGTLLVTGGYTGAGNLVVNGGSLTLDMGSGVASFNGDSYANSPLIGDGNYTGTLTLQSGTLNIKTNASTSSIRLGCNGASANGTLIVNGGSLNVPGRILMGANTSGSQATLTVAGGQVNLGYPGSYTTSGDPACGVLWFGAYKSTVNLSGGTLAMFGVRNTTSATVGSAFNFNGGTLKAVAHNNTDFLKLPANMPAVVQSGGAIIDDGGFGATIGVALTDGGGGGGLTKQGSGTLTLSAAGNSYTGGTLVKAGILALGASATLPSTPSITVSNGAIFGVSAQSFTLGSSQALKGGGTVNGSVTTSGSATSVISPGAGTVAGTLTFNHTLTMTSGSTFYLSVGASAGSGNCTVAVTGTLNLNSTVFNIDAQTLMTPGGSLGAGNYVLVTAGTLNGSPSSTAINWVGAAPANAGLYTLEKFGNNIILKYTSTTVVNSVTANPASVARGQRMTITAAVSAASPPITVTVDASPLGGSANLALVSDGAGNYTNEVTVTAGTTSGVKTLNVTATDSLLIQGFGIGSVTVVPATVTWSGLGVDNNWSTAANWVGNYLPGLVGDSVVFAGTTQLSNNMDSSYTLAALTFNNDAGSFTIANAANMLTLSAGLTNHSANLQTLAVPVALNGAQTINAAGGNIAISRPVSGGAGLALAGTNTLTLSGVNTYAGATVIGSGGTLAISGAGQLGSGAYAGGITDNGLLTYGSTANQTLSGVISGTGGLTKNGSGTLTLSSGGSTYQGNVTVGSGTLLATGATGGANPASGSLGTPTVARTLTVNNGGILSFGNNDLFGNHASTMNVALVVNAGGTVVNTNGANGYFNALGPITLNGGALMAIGGVNSSFPSYALKGLVMAGGATTSTISASGANSQIALGGGVVTGTVFDVGAGSTLNVSAVLQDGLSSVVQPSYLTKTGPGTMVLSGANTYTGGTTVGGGTLTVATGGTIASASVVTVSNGTTLAVTGSGNLNSTSITLNPGGVLDMSAASSALALGSGRSLIAGRTNSPATDVLGSVILSGGAINVAGTGTAATLSLANDLTLSGGTITLDLSRNPASGNDSMAASGTVTLPSVPTTMAVNQLEGGLSAGTYTLISGASVVGNTNNLVLTGVGGGYSRQTFSLVNTGTALQLVVSGESASLLWTAQNGTDWDYSSLSWTNLGTLLADKFYDADSVTLDDTALSGTINLATALLPGPVTFSNSALAYHLGGPGSLSAHGLNKWGSGAVDFTNTGALAFSSGVTVNQGSLALNTGLGNSLGAVTLNAGTLTLGTPNTISGAFLNSGTLAFATNSLGTAGAITFGGWSTLRWLEGNAQDLSARVAPVDSGVTATFDVGSNNVIAATAIHGAGHWTKTGPGTLTLSTNNSTLSGNVTVQQGTLNVTGGLLGPNPSGTALGVTTSDTRRVTVEAGATLVLAVHDVFGNGGAWPKLHLNIAGVVTNRPATAFNGAFNTLGPVTFNGGILSGVGGALSTFQMYSFLSNITVVGSSPSWIMAGPNGYTGIHLGSPATNVITFDVAAVTAGDYDFFVSAPLIDRNSSQGGGSAGLNKTGAGIMVLSAANTYTGPTIVSEGWLSLFPGGALASPTINIVPGARFDVAQLSGSFVLGAGQTLIGGRTTNPATDVSGSFTSGGAINPAGTGAIGTLTVEGEVTLADGTVLMEINKSGSVLASDRIAVTGQLHYGGRITVTLSGDALAGGEVFQLFSASGFSGSFATLNLPPLSPGMNWFLGNLAADGTIMANRPPVSSNTNATVTQDSVLILAIAKLLARCSDPDGDSLTVSGVSATSTNGGVVMLTLTNTIVYTPVADYVGLDQFSYTVSDGRGGTVAGLITVNVTSSNAPSLNIVSGPTMLPNGHFRVGFAGVPNRTYRVDRAINVNGPWEIGFANLVAGPSGLFELDDPNTPPQPTCFYRTMSP